MEVRIKIERFDDRSAMVAILARNGYKTWEEVEKSKYGNTLYNPSHYVYFENKET